MSHNTTSDNIITRTQCWAAAIALVIGLLFSRSVARADEKVEKSELPKLTDMQLPTADELLRADDSNGKAFDWIVLKAAVEADRTVLVVSPLEIRPDTLRTMAETYVKVEATKPKNEEERNERSARMKNLKQLIVKLPGNAVAEYALPISQIDHIILFEELMLRRADELLKEGDIRKAYELLLRVEKEFPSWELSKPRFESLLLVESGLRARDGDIYAALALLDELANRNINNPELRIRFGEIVAPMIETAVADEDFHKARYLISRIERVFPGHETASAWQGRMQMMADSLLTEAKQQTSQREFAAAADVAWKAEAIWPSSGNSRAIFAQTVARHQVLHVAIDDSSSSEIVYPSPRESDERPLELVEVPLFEPTSADELTYFRSSYFEIWTRPISCEVLRCDALTQSAIADRQRLPMRWDGAWIRPTRCSIPAGVVCAEVWIAQRSEDRFHEFRWYRILLRSNHCGGESP
ncbi:MAG: hypothetical protein WKF77_26725 [Planctomycetaceae bacterium]